jgi:hypothetical protein
MTRVTTARCYTCHTLRPLSSFPYRRKDNSISTSSRLKRYVGVLLQRPGAWRSDKRSTVGAIYRYRCVHPKKGTCPATVTGVVRPMTGVEGTERFEVDDHPLGLERGGQEEVVGVEVEVEVEIQACREERGGLRKEKEGAREKLREYIGAVEQSKNSARLNG